MPEQSQLIALQAFQQGVVQAETLGEVAACLHTLLRQHLPAASFVLSPAYRLTAPRPKHRYPIPHTPYVLAIDQDEPWPPADDLFLGLAAGILAHAPPLQFDAGLQAALDGVQQDAAAGLEQGDLVQSWRRGFLSALPQASGLLRLHASLPEEREKDIWLGQDDAGSREELVGLAGEAGETRQVVLRQQSARMPAAMAIPLEANRQLLAVLAVQWPHAGTVPRTIQAFLRHFGSIIAISLGNRWLAADARRRARQLETIFQITESVRALNPLEPTLADIHTKIAAAFNAPTCTIALYDEKSETLTFPYAIDDHQPVQLAPVRLREADSLFAWVIRHRQPVASSDWHHDRNRPVSGIVDHSPSRSILCFPLQTQRQEVLGVISVQSDRPDAFDQSGYELMAAIASHVAVIIENAQLYSTTQDLVDNVAREYLTATALRQSISIIAASLDLEDVLHHLLHALREVITYDSASIALLNEHNEMVMSVMNGFDDEARVAEQARLLLKGSRILARMLADRETVLLEDTRNDPDWVVVPGAEHVRSWIGAPLQCGDRMLGLLMIDSSRPGAYDIRDKWLVSSLASHAAVAVENSRHYALAQQHLKDMSLLVEMAQQVTGSLEPEQVLEITVRTVKSLIPEARASTVVLLSEDGEELVVKAAAGIDPAWLEKARMPVGAGISGKAVAQGRPVYVTNALQEPDFLFFDPTVRSLLAVPLMSRGQALGALTVDSLEVEAFTPYEMQLLTVAAAQVSVALANARLFQEARERAAKLNLAYVELQEIDRLKDELVQNVSHELRTPLTFIRGYVDLVLAGDMGLLTGEQESALQIVARNTDVIVRLLDDIVTLQQISPSTLKMRAFSLAGLVAEVAHMYTLKVEGTGLELDVKPTLKSGVVYADPGRIKQVLENLIDNAIKFSPQGGTITLALDEHDDTVVVRVVDEGIGIPQEQRQRIFDRFYQVDGTLQRHYGGAGIGLSLVKRIIEAHNGRVWVDSTLGHGSTFYFTLPRVAD